MPCLGLVVTSIGFFVPAIIARMKGMHKDTRLIGSLAITSVLYHGTVHPLALLVDTAVAHFVSIGYAIQGIRDVIVKRRHDTVVGVALGCMSAFMYYQKSLKIADETESRRWHMNVHLTAQAALLAFVYRGKGAGDGAGDGAGAGAAIMC